ncbi:MAG: DUF1365 domain-containing protein [Planctomycetota bacterium]
MSSALASCLYRGEVRHRRFAPRPHDFSYPVTYLYLDLDEVDEVFSRSRWLSFERPNLISFSRRHYHGPPERELREAVFDTVEKELGRRPCGPVRVFTQPTVAGFCFNPVSFYYCFREDGENLDAVVAEITNTPWGERRAYVIDGDAGSRPGKLHTRFPKDFHVSPFLDHDIDFDWSFVPPGGQVVVHMEDIQRGDGKSYAPDGSKLFDATLVAERVELTPRSVRRWFLRHPLACVQILGAIYLQAGRLWLKRTPFYIHPDKRAKGVDDGAPRP